MKKILFGLLAVVLLVIVGVVGVAMTKPDVIHMERSITAAATPADVFVHANDFTRFVEWSPWSDIDPHNKVAFSDPPSGEGAWYSWSGNAEVGSGKMTLTSATPNAVVHHLAFITPFQSEADTTIAMTAKGDDQVEITWSYDQDADFTAKLMAVFMDMDAMLGPDYDKGLKSLKAKAEATAKQRIEAEAAAAVEAAAAAAADAAAADIDHTSTVDGPRVLGTGDEGGKRVLTTTPPKAEGRQLQR